MAARPDDLIRAPALEIARLVCEREVSAPDVARAHLARIDDVEPTIGAFVAVRAAEALSEAEELAERSDLGSLPLAGVPVAIKDNTDVAGLATRHGSGAMPDAPADRDDELVRRLRAAGCIVIGKTKMPEFAIWPFTETAVFGLTRNPWDTGRTPGGSSGGSGAAVATGMAALALGSDGGGSIRIPAACCGVFGIKPTPGLVPVAGDAGEHWYGLSAFGPLARTVRDGALALDVLAGSEPAGGIEPSKSMTIAFSVRHPTLGARTSPAVRRSLEEAAEALRSAGHTLIEAKPPYPADLGIRFSRRWFPGIAQDADGLDERALEPRTRGMARLGRRISRWAKPASADPFAARAAEWLGNYDALLAPTLANTAVPVGRWEGKGWPRTMLSVANWLYTTPWNLAGVPAASVPFGTDGGLPIGLQVVATAGNESAVLAVAAELERLRPWPQIADPAPAA